MNIDLLIARNGQAGLISSENLVKKLAGVVMDTQTGLMTLEYADMDHMDLNIPVGNDITPALELCKQIHIGAVKGGHIGQAYQVPLMFLDDPYRAESLGTASQDPRPLAAFEYFVKSATYGQPVHREDLDNEDALGCVLGDAVPSALQFAPHLERRHQLEAQPTHAPNVPGLGLGTSGAATRGNQTRGGNKE